jgi:hypothetical protein
MPATAIGAAVAVITSTHAPQVGMAAVVIVTPAALLGAALSGDVVRTLTAASPAPGD